MWAVWATVKEGRNNQFATNLRKGHLDAKMIPGLVARGEVSPCQQNPGVSLAVAEARQGEQGSLPSQSGIEYTMNSSSRWSKRHPLPLSKLELK